MNDQNKNFGFKVPLDYFKDLENKTIKDVKEGFNIQNDSFVPNNYFSSFKLDFLDKKRSLRFKKNLIIFNSSILIIIIISFIIFIQNNQKEIIKIDNSFTDIEIELRINPEKAYEISRSIEKLDFKSFNSNFSNFKSNKIHPSQMYFNNSFNIYYEEDNN